jgi:hypothetical protein
MVWQSASLESVGSPAPLPDRKPAMEAEFRWRIDRLIISSRTTAAGSAICTPEVQNCLHPQNLTLRQPDHLSQLVYTS